MTKFTFSQNIRIRTAEEDYSVNGSDFYVGLPKRDGRRYGRRIVSYVVKYSHFFEHGDESNSKILIYMGK